MDHRARIRVLGGVCAALAVLITPALLFAHAHLVRSTPSANATLAESPSSLSLWFSERPELRFTSIDLLDSAGTELALGAPSQVTGDAMGITASIGQPLKSGRYAVVWRTAAADGHATNGRFEFIVTGSRTTSAAARAPAPVAGTSESPSQPGDYSRALRWAELVALLTVIGTVVFRLLVLRDAAWSATLFADGADRARRLAQAAVILFIVAALMRVVAQSDLIPNASAARTAAIVSTVRDTRWGHGWGIGAAGAVLVLVALLVARAKPVAWVGAAIGAIAMALSESMTGHAAAQPNHTALAIAADLAHVLGAGGWVGGLLAVVLAGLPAVARLNAVERADAGSHLVRAYHRSAMQCVAIVLITACIAVPLRLTAVSDLWGTTYGRTLLLKVAFVAIMLGFGFYHWRTAVVPDWLAKTNAKFRRTASAELVVGALIVAVTAVLIGTTLPSS